MGLFVRISSRCKYNDGVVNKRNIEILDFTGLLKLYFVIIDNHRFQRYNLVRHKKFIKRIEMKRTREIAQFKAKSDNGEIYSVIEFQEYETILSSIGTVNETEGITRWKTTTGDLLKPVGSDRYRNVNTNEIIQKIT